MEKSGSSRVATFTSAAGATPSCRSSSYANSRGENAASGITTGTELTRRTVTAGTTVSATGGAVVSADACVFGSALVISVSAAADGGVTISRLAMRG